MPARKRAKLFVLDEAKKNELWAIFFLAVAILVFVSLISFDINDLSMYTSTLNRPPKNFAGIFGAWIGCGLFFSIGLSSYVIPILILFWAIGRFLGTKPQNFYVKLTGTLVFILASSTFLGLLFYEDSTARFQKGGVIGLKVADILVKYFGRAGSFIIDGTLVLLSMLLATEFLIFPLVMACVKWIKNLLTNFTKKPSN
ncbi:MAG: DNA translocase FtsK 4TM domain-containing protein, partial [Candidatus Omnitrophica bacterium]|nr:DNA translocase FtsK 4TM domain-containing protein [Candidatus Omnitrophota bacterium]